MVPITASGASAARALDLAPLLCFWDRGRGRPQLAFLEPEALPEEARHLLVHATAMTPRLRHHHGSRIDLDVRAQQVSGDRLARAAVLARRSDGRPVAFGAIGIELGAVPDACRAAVLDGKIPFGAILERHAVAHTSHPRGFFAILADEQLAQLLQATVGQTLYGRCNELRVTDGSLLAEVVEILPDASSS